MDFKSDAQIDAGSVSSGGGGRGGGLAVGGIGGVIVMILSLLLGFNPGDLLGSGGGNGEPQGQGSVNANCKTGADVERDPDCRWPAYMTSLRQYWEQAYKGYKPTSMTTFSGGVQTACGTANSQVGPFYCPGDSKIYIDKEFVGKLLEQLGTQSSYPAEAYIVAHEYGHHIQNLQGSMQRANRQDTGPQSDAVRLELQADCYAGVWAHHAANTVDEDGVRMLEPLTQEDIASGLSAAAAVGDDHIQGEVAGGGIHPESWTHGSSEQRQAWFITGYQKGTVESCDTFAVPKV